MKKLNPYLLFYFGKFFLSLAFSFFVLVWYRIPTLAFITLTLVSLLIWFYHHYLNDKKKQSLYFYFNLGISELKLYLFTFCLNLLILISINQFL